MSLQLNDCLKKKPEAANCIEYCTISLIAHMGKVESSENTKKKD
jgi:hypothetical protein